MPVGLAPTTAAAPCIIPLARVWPRGSRGEDRSCLVLVLFAAAAVGVWWFGFRQPPVVEPPRQTDSPKPVTVSSFDEFNQDLAKRVTDVLVPGGAPDFQVVVTPATDPIGTLYRKGRSVPYDDMSCAPPADPASRSMPNAFPS